MSFQFLQPRPLACHPTAPNPAIRALRAAAGYATNGALHFSFELIGDLAALLIPPVPPIPQTSPAGAGRRADGLWRHTCFEAFIAPAGTAAYYEFNFSPDGRWAVYAFAAYRQANTSADTAHWPAPEITVQRAPDRLHLHATLAPNALDALSPALRASALDTGLSAVVETRVQSASPGIPPLSYWALRHPSERPDFHDRRAFTLRLAPAGTIDRNTTP